MTTDIIASLVTTVLTAAAIGYINKAAQKRPDPSITGQYILRVHKIYNITGYASLIFGILMVLSTFFEKFELNYYILTLVCFVFFAGLGTLCILYYRNHYLLFDNTMIEVRGPLGRLNRLKWSEIQTAGFNSMSGLIKLKGKDGQAIRINRHLVGLPRFIAMLEDKTGLKADQLQLPVKRDDIRN